MSLGLRKYFFRAIRLFVPYFAGLCFFAGVVLFFSLPIAFRRQNYFSENGLMSRIAASDRLQTHSLCLKRQHGEQNFSDVVHISGAHSSGSEQVFLFVNSRCPRSVAVAKCLTEHLNGSLFLSVDMHIVFAPEDQLAAAIAHHVSNGVARGGLVINICAPSRMLCINTIGDNGILPNLDFVNVVTDNAVLHGLVPNLFCQTVQQNVPQLQLFRRFCHSLLGQFLCDYYAFIGATLLSSRTSALHSPLRSEGIHSMTLESGPPTEEVDGMMQAIVGVVEKTVRCLSNLNERLHHSYFLWFPLATWEFIDGEVAQLQVFFFIGALVSVAIRASHEGTGVRFTILGALPSLCGFLFSFAFSHVSVISTAAVSFFVGAALPRDSQDKNSMLCGLCLVNIVSLGLFSIVHPAMSYVGGMFCCFALVPLYSSTGLLHRILHVVGILANALLILFLAVGATLLDTTLFFLHVVAVPNLFFALAMQL